MDAHYWLFPWLSLFASLVAAVGGVLLGLRPTSSTTRPPSLSPLLIVVWLVAIVLMVLGGLKLGDWAAIDYIPARGVLAGAIGGALLSVVSRRNLASSAAKCAALFGIATATISAAWLWLTHGEISGLTAVVFSAITTLLCFVEAPAITDPESAISPLTAIIAIYLTALAGAVLLGFTRAGTLGDIYWAGIPLMLGSAISVGILIAAAVNKFGTIARSIAISITTLAVLIPLGVVVAHLLPVIGLTVLGALAVALPLPLLKLKGGSELPTYLGLTLLVSSITVAFTLLSGYGLALLALGAITVAALAAVSNIEIPVGWPAFPALLLVYRLEILQNGSSIRSIGPANIWDLLAIALGLVLPRLITAWVSSYAPRRAWSAALQWVLAVIIPALVLDYIWQPRTLTGLFLGLAIGQLVSEKAMEVRRTAITAITSILTALLLFLFLPGLDILTAPSRNVRIAGVAVLAAFAILRIIFHRRAPAVAKAA